MIGTKLKCGDAITWKHCPPGGYGYVFYIPGIVLGFGRGRVKIRVKTASGAEVTRFVKPENLRQKSQP